MATANFFAPGFDDQIEQQGIERQRRMADMLRQQSQTPLQGQMAGQFYAPPSWTQGLAKLLQGYASGKQESAADEKQRALAEAVKGRNAQEMNAFMSAAKGREGYGANEMDSEAVPATPPDMAKALQIGMSSHVPGLQAAAGTLFNQQFVPKTPKWEKYEMPDGKGGMSSGFVDINSSDPVSTFKKGGSQPAKAEYVNGVPVNAYTQEKLGAEIPKQADSFTLGDTRYGPDGKPIVAYSDPNKPFGPDGKPNQPFMDYSLNKAKAGAPKMINDNRNYATQESEQSRKYGAALGEMRANINQAGFEAPGKLAQLKRMENLLEGIDGGKAAPTLAQIASVAQSFGVKLDPKLGVKQAAEALAKEMAGSLRKPGSGTFTDKDFDNFLAQIPDLSKSAEGRKQIMVTMRAAIERDQRAAQHARDYAKKNGGVIDDNYFDSLAKFYADNPVTTPAMPAGGSSGRVFDDADAILNRGKK